MVKIQKSMEPHFKYDAVCQFIESQMSVVEHAIHEDKNRLHSVAMPIEVNVNTIQKFIYADKKISAEYLATPSKTIIALVHLKANFFPMKMQSKNYFLKKFEIEKGEEITDTISLSCDAITLQLEFIGSNLKDVTIFTNFID